MALHRRTLGNDHPQTLGDIRRLGTFLSKLGDHAGAQPLLEEALAGLRLALGDEANETLDTMELVAMAHGRVCATAKARLLMEEAVGTVRRIRPVDPNTFFQIGNLGAALLQAGDLMVALALREEAAASALQELGPEHPCTQQLTGKLDELRQTIGAFSSGTRAVGTLVGLASKPELNGQEVYVVGFDAGKGRYRVRHHKGNLRAGKPIGISSCCALECP